MCETKRDVWRREVREGTKMESVGGGLEGNFVVVRIPDHLGNQKKCHLGQTISKMCFFFDPNWSQNAHKMGKMESVGGSTGPSLGF